MESTMAPPSARMRGQGSCGFNYCPSARESIVPTTVPGSQPLETIPEQFLAQFLSTQRTASLVSSSESEKLLDGVRETGHSSILPQLERSVCLGAVHPERL